MFCSLIVKRPQRIPPRTYVALRFDTESTDLSGLHRSSNLALRDSALIIPTTTAVGLLSAMVFWDASDATQYLHRFSRDPYGEIDNTCTNDKQATVGANFHTFSWPMTVRKGQPLALMVSHNASGPVNVTLAEFKLWIP